MLDIKLVREDAEGIAARLAKRGGSYDIAAVAEADRRRRELLHQTEQMRARQNQATQAIAAAKRAGEDAEAAIAEQREASAAIKALDEEVREADRVLNELMLSLPNLLDDSVPPGRDESDNREERVSGAPRTLDFPPKDHVELGERLGLLDFGRAAKIAGARFCLTRGAAAQLERALISLMLDTHTRQHGYTEVLPPFLVNSDSLIGTGQLPKFADDSFKVDRYDLWLIPTAEVPVTNIYRDEILDEAQLPIRLCAYTPCFRSEAGNYGKDTRGMIRQHQFNKVELVKFTTPEQSKEEHEALTRDAERILQLLELPYRVVTLCSGDTGFSSSKTYDIEVWLPGQQKYREISSCSNFTDFQARRANIRFKRAKKNEFVHTLNGSGLAVGRTLVAIFENYQQADGSVVVPEALRGYMGGLEVIRKGE